MEEDLILATMPIIPKYEVEEVFGVIYGSSTRTRGAGDRIISGIQAPTEEREQHTQRRLKKPEKRL